MKKGLLRLNDEELYWLKGKLSTIDIQKGCPVQCIICGADAPMYSGSMVWSDYMLLSDSILEVREKKGISLLGHSFTPFWSSDPIYYHSFDGNTKRTIYDIAKDITLRHKKGINITTAGWEYGNNYMQKAVEKIVEMFNSEEYNLSFCYSIKTTSKSVMHEYNLFLKKSKHNYIANIDFIGKSHYVSNLIHNIGTLHSLEEFMGIYDFQAIGNKDIKLLNKEYILYSSLFSEKFMKNLHTYLTTKKVIKSDMRCRNFSGIGKALDIGKISIDDSLRENTEIINLTSEIPSNKYSVHISCLGNIQIYFGEDSSLSKLLVPYECFIAQAKQSDDGEDKQTYQMLANLQGKELLR